MTNDSNDINAPSQSARRLDEILRAWRRSLCAGQFDRVLYLCSPRALPYLSRALERMIGEWAVEVEPLNGQLGGAAAVQPGL